MFIAFRLVNLTGIENEYFPTGQEIDDLIPEEKKSVPENFPDLSKHNNWMAKCMTPDIFAKLQDKKTPSGFTLDRCIQTGWFLFYPLLFQQVVMCPCPYLGVDNPGHPFIMTVGLVAGDEETYTTFSELFDPVISARHGG